MKKIIQEFIKKHGKMKIFLSLTAMKILFSITFATIYYFYFYQ